MAEDKVMGESDTVQAAEKVKIRLMWSRDDHPVVLTANQFAVQFDGEQFYLTVGQVPPPLAIGSPEAVIKELANTPVQITKLAQFSLTPGQLAALINLLQQSYKRVQATLEAEQKEGS